MAMTISGSGGLTFPDASTQAAGFVQSIGTTGYQKLPSGLILQWGAAASGTTVTVTFPVAFPSAVYIVMATPYNTGGAGVYTNIVSITTTSFGWNPLNNQGPAYWIAIGK